MVRLGIFLLVIGFGSLGLNAIGYEFRILSWADEYQPWTGIGIGVLGVILSGFAMLGGKAQEGEHPPAA